MDSFLLSTVAASPRNRRAEGPPFAVGLTPSAGLGSNLSTDGGTTADLNPRERGRYE
jgi:hypothetical protein